MFGKVGQAIGLWRAWVRGQKKGRQIMDKPLASSLTVWGAVILGVGKILQLIGEPLSAAGPVQWGSVGTEIVAVIGLVVAIIGGRRALGMK